MFSHEVALSSKPPISPQKPVNPRVAALLVEQESVGHGKAIANTLLADNSQAMGTCIGSLQFHNMFQVPSKIKEDTIQSNIISFIKYHLGRDSTTIDTFGMFQATSISIRNTLIDNWRKTLQHQTATKARTVNYLSLEFLMGRALTNTLYNLELGHVYKNALKDLGFTIEALQQEESDAALGNGGLGRLAACFIDSMASMDIASYGYGIRYSYGMFKQTIRDGCQEEFPDYWLTHGSEPFPIIERLDKDYTVRFYGYSSSEPDVKNPKRKLFRWEGGETVRAIAHDCLCPGHHTTNVSNIRLWSAQASCDFNLAAHSSGDYYSSIRERMESENISFVLYPSDSTDSGKLLRLKQEYFFVSASLQDMIYRCKNMGCSVHDFHKYFAIQLNDTHPALGIPELMRLLMDEERLEWSEAWTIVSNTFCYTNHTVLPEALEKWNLGIIAKLLPRHTEIIFEINRRFIDELRKIHKCPDDVISKLSIFEECGGSKKVRMANLSIIGSYKVNGVAALHTEIIRNTLFKEFNDLYPNKIVNVTNGVTPRRWIAQANPLLSHYLTKYLKEHKIAESEHEWLSNMQLLTSLVEPLSKDSHAIAELLEIKKHNKQRLANYIQRHVSSEYTFDRPIPTAMIFDTQVKRIHEYKRQLLNILQAIHFYLTLKQMHTHEEKEAFMGSGVCKIFAGKAASAYVTAKRIIKLINNVSKRINNDPDTCNYLQVYFLPNYNVSSAEIIFPGTDLSEQISTAGAEASGTGNMKACMNGGVIVGTMDGANVEIYNHVGEENIFIFGADTNTVTEVREQYSQGRRLQISTSLNEVLDCIESGFFGGLDDYNTHFKPLVDMIRAGNDWYLVSVDFESYNECYQTQIVPLFRDKKTWGKMALNNCLRMSYFSSDRSIRDYCEKIWNVEPCNPDSSVGSCLAGVPLNRGA
ncbi:Glycogen phosphorylase [Giardia lamblia P15]|uniref:Alpha-1,4 glucan phosphorylase n=1 Tax=Giardia intestinalis (strain P15) TaxID=658858 RepID=E1F6R5_GIAIA|nr:Glycogen phosphorylase [Giardia lamblia P15]